MRIIEGIGAKIETRYLLQLEGYYQGNILDMKNNEGTAFKICSIFKFSNGRFKKGNFTKKQKTIIVLFVQIGLKHNEKATSCFTVTGLQATNEVSEDLQLFV